MPSSSSEILREVCRVHKDAILSLRFDEGLPLSSSIPSRRTVMRVMEDEHHFKATQWQYEDQLKKWGAAKYLKQSDWRVILPIYDRLKAQGSEPQIRLGDEILDEQRIKRARRRYLGDRTTSSPATIDAPPARNRLWRLEIRRNVGEYYDYILDGQSSDSPDNLNILDVMQTGRAEPDFDFQTLESDPMWAPSSPFGPNACTPRLDVFCPATTPPETGSNIQETPLGVCLQPNSPLPLWGTLARSTVPSSPQERELSTQVRCGSRALSVPRRMDFISYIDSVLESIYSDIRRTTPYMLLDTDVSSLPTMLESFVSDAAVTYGFDNGFDLAPRLPDVVSKIPQILIASVIDGLPNLNRIPPKVLLSWMETDPAVRSSIVAGLRSKNVALSKALANRVFHRAVIAGDEDVVGIILETTTGQLNQIDLNSKSCYLWVKPITPLDVAAQMRRLGVAQKLLHFGAAADLIESSELRLYLHISDDAQDIEDDREDAIVFSQIVDILFANGANVSVAVLESLISVTKCTSDVTVLEKLVQAVFHQSHWGLLTCKPPRERFDEFDDEDPRPSVLEQVATKLDDKSARRLFVVFYNL
ncbi:hypothetical protein DER46DRAFT_570575 [Fusarium sp. MPI-SDFR-AT-0072]|nr:hypothetical protein DER46DRAFT_570575 [Fusarium sp. MPI-SDFR-AT-0072]